MAHPPIHRNVPPGESGASLRRCNSVAVCGQESTRRRDHVSGWRERYHNANPGRTSWRTTAPAELAEPGGGRHPALREVVAADLAAGGPSPHRRRKARRATPAAHRRGRDQALAGLVVLLLCSSRPLSAAWWRHLERLARATRERCGRQRRRRALRVGRRGQPPRPAASRRRPGCDCGRHRRADRDRSQAEEPRHLLLRPRRRGWRGSLPVDGRARGQERRRGAEGPRSRHHRSRGRGPPRQATLLVFGAPASPWPAARPLSQRLARALLELAIEAIRTGGDLRLR